MYSTVEHSYTARVTNLHNATILAVFAIFKTVRLAEKVFVSLGLCTEISGVREKIEMRAEMSVGAQCKVSNTVQLYRYLNYARKY